MSGEGLGGPLCLRFCAASAFSLRYFTLTYAHREDGPVRIVSLRQSTVPDTPGGKRGVVWVVMLASAWQGLARTEAPTQDRTAASAMTPTSFLCENGS